MLKRGRICQKFLKRKLERDHFETDSVNVMNNRPLVAKKQRKFQYILALLILLENHEKCH